MAHLFPDGPLAARVAKIQHSDSRDRPKREGRARPGSQGDSRRQRHDDRHSKRAGSMEESDVVQAMGSMPGGMGRHRLSPAVSTATSSTGDIDVRRAIAQQLVCQQERTLDRRKLNRSCHMMRTSLGAARMISGFTQLDSCDESVASTHRDWWRTSHVLWKRVVGTNVLPRLRHRSRVSLFHDARVPRRRRSWLDSTSHPERHRARLRGDII
jgi:hypothetical protein